MNSTIKKPLVSVVIPTYNYAAYIAEAVNSALQQTYKNIEVIIIDDASTDNTAEVVKQFGSSVTYIRAAHGGVSNARNIGASKARGAYIVFLDADDKLSPVFIEETLPVLRANKDIGFVYTQMQYFEASDHVTQYPGYHLGYLKIKNFLGQNVLMKSKLPRLHPYDTRIAIWEDWDFFLTLAEQGVTGQLVNKPLLYYRKHKKGGSALDGFDGKKQLYSTHMLRTKHWKLYGVVDTAVHWAWYLYNSLKFHLNAKAYRVKEPNN